MLPDLLAKVQPMDVLRVYLGIALALKGIYFIMNMDEVERLAGGVGLMEDLVAWFVVLAHVVGGACLAIGFVTRVAAGLNVAVLLGAIMFVHSNEGLFSASQGLQLSLFALVALLLLMWRGSGQYSVDHLLKD